MQTDPPVSDPPSLAEALEQLLRKEGTEGASVGGVVLAVREKGFGLVLLILSLPSALPVPAPGYSTPFGIVIALIALQMLVGRHSIWLPAQLRRIPISAEATDKMVRAASRILPRIERLIRPRHHWIRARAGRIALALVVVLMAVLMILPIPLTNTAPAFVVFLLGVGLAEEDGLLTLLAFAAGCFAILLYAGIIYLLITQGPEAVEEIRQWLKNLAVAVV
ncbi:MAG: exopolysaccharide biosynthesis protein [Opitutales bacterium]